MPLTVTWMCLAAIAVSPIAALARAADVLPPASTRVEVWHSGDDGLTQRLADAVRKGFESSSDFRLESTAEPGNLVVLIPKHVESKHLRWTPFVGRRTQIFYSVEFRIRREAKTPDSTRSPREGAPVSTQAGSCREDRIAGCATEIVRAARSVVSQRR